MNHPITISGGGLAGLSLAIGLRRHGVPVSLHEAGTYPRHRVCGEFISGVSPATLQAIGIEDCLADAHRHHHFSWFAGDRILRSGKLKEPALAISRYRLDRRLCERALELGAKIETSSRLTIQPHQAGFVRASGRVPAQGKWLGLKGHFRGLKPRSDLEMHTGSRAYLGITPVEDGWCNVCGLFEVEKIGDEYFSFFTQCQNANACSILLRGASKDVLNEIERNLQDALGVARNVVVSPQLAPGGGALEMELACRLTERASSIENN